MVRETAAAAVAVREREGSLEVCLVEEDGKWGVPLVLLGKGEIPKQTALRALHQASGVKATLLDVDPSFYKTQEQLFRKGIDKVRREIHYYKVRVAPDASGGTWLPAAQALEQITSKSMREVVQAALGPLGAPEDEAGEGAGDA